MFLDTKYYTSIPIFVLFVLSFGISNAEQAPNIIGEYNNWTALTYKERGKVVCFMSPAPRNSPKKWVSKPKNVRRGKIYLLVTHRPAHGTRDEVSVHVGYPLKKDSEVVADIDGRKFRMFTDNNTAWARDAKPDRAIAQAMRGGTILTIKGISSRGTKTTDTYSLSGFTAAHNDINGACR